MRRRPVVLVVLVVLAAVVAGAVVYRRATSGWGPPQRTVAAWYRPTPDGIEVTLHTGDEACERVGPADVVEEAGRVVVTVRVSHRRGPMTCTSIALTSTVALRLSRPLGGRAVVDAATGRPVPTPPATLGPDDAPLPPLTTPDPAASAHQSPVRWDHAVAVADLTLDVHFVANAAGCRRLTSVRVAESPSAVTVTLVEGAEPAREPGVCPQAGVTARVRVTLGAPVGDRRLLDGSESPPAPREVRRP